jgi:hypothetical protein
MRRPPRSPAAGASATLFRSSATDRLSSHHQLGATGVGIDRVLEIVPSRKFVTCESGRW